MKALISSWLHPAWRRDERTNSSSSKSVRGRNVMSPTLLAVKFGSFLLGLEDIVEGADLVNVVRLAYHGELA